MLGQGIGQIILALVVAQYAYFARTTHGAVTVEWRKDYIEAARSTPLPTLRVLFRHLLPNVMPPLIVVATVQVASAIPQPGAADRPLRILFIFAWLAGGLEETLVRRLAQTLVRARYRVDALPCLRRSDAVDPAHVGLTAIGINVDLAACDLGFEDTVRYLAGKLVDYEIIVSCQDVADIYPALERLRHRPPLIEYGRKVAEAQAGPKHLTTRYVGASE
ncbi:MAG: ABC transporter permease subunit [Paracoccaceae bacterium]